MDPIEKEPLYHFHPSSDILSIGTRGCNMKCPYCQNWHISQDLSAQTTYQPPEKIVQLALNKNSIGIAFTYSEPIIWIEYVLDVAKAAREKGLKNVMVTNGFINQEPLKDLLEYTDAMNIDLKSYSAETYKKVQKANLDDVKAAIEAVYESGCHLEITTLIVTGINDKMSELNKIVDYIASIDKNIPWHISRYYPGYNYNEPPTDLDFLLSVHENAVKKLNHVYCGNIPSNLGGSDTLCPSCGTVVVRRSGYHTEICSLENGSCGKCGFDINIIQ